MLRRLGVAGDPGHRPPYLQVCLESVLEQSPLVMEDLLAGLKAALVGAGKKAALVTDPLLRQTIEDLAEHAPALKQGFAAHLRVYVFGGQSSRQLARQVMRFDDFQFLDSEQIDSSIELAQTEQVVQVAVQDSLPTLNAMLSKLLGWSSVQAHLNPLKPAAFVHALRETLEEFLPDRAARASVMALSAGLLGASLHRLYRDVTEWLRSQGVEPVHMAPSASSSLWNPANVAESTVVRTLLTLEKLRRLLSGELNPNPGAAGQVDFSSTIPVSFEALQDMKLVEPMMKRLSVRAALAPAAADAPVANMLDEKPQQRKELAMRLGREVVLLMLDHLMQDARLLAPVRVSLKSLEPVLVQLSQEDGRLFSERQHPARLFLDRMTHRSLAFSSVQEPGYADFQSSLDSAVSQLKNGAADAAAFAQVLRVLDDHWASEEAAQHRRAATAARGLLHAEQRNLLAQRLGRQFAERLQGLKVPEPVATFLRGPWAHVVAQAQLSVADGSVDPGGYLALVDDLVWSVQLRLTRRNRGRLVQMVPDMLVKMRHGLELIAYPPERMAAFFETLISLHEQVFDSARAGAEPREEAPVAAADDFWMVDQEAADSGYLDDAAPAVLAAAPRVEPAGDPVDWQVDSLTMGSWVDLALAGSWVRAQLSWASPERTLYLFIAGNGMAHSMSRKTVERLKKSRLIRLVSDLRVMDAALDAVARTALRNDLLAPRPKAQE